MTRLRRSAGTFALSALAASAVAGASAPAALAADVCPNAAVRAQQQSQHLPRCMAYEKVTPAEKGGETPGAIQITEDGNGLTFMVNAGIEDALSFATARYRSMRSADGRWTTNALMPAMDGPRLPNVNDAPGDPLAVTSDLSQMVFAAAYPINPNDQGIVNVRGNVLTTDQYMREPDGSFTWLVPDPSVPDTSALPVYFGAASSDLERVVLGTARTWDPRVTTTDVEQVYLWTRTGTHLVSVLPNGDLPTVIPTGNPSDGDTRAAKASADARRIAFAAGDSDYRRLYVRFNADDPATAFTREVSVGPNGEQCDEPRMLALSPDGTQFIFNCRNAILPGGPAEGTYIRDLDGGAGAIRRLGNNDDFGAVAATADFSRVYLSRLASNNSISLMRDGGEPEVVAEPVSGTDIGKLQISDDGEYLAFDSDSDFGLPGVDHRTLNGKQVYLYAARTGTLTCVSCRQDGSPTEGLGTLDGSAFGDGGGGAIAGGMRPVSTSGTVTFTSAAALVPEDTNGLADAYAWVDGRVVLLSGGRGPLASMIQGASTDGSSLFFRTVDALVPEDRDGGTYDLYVARVNGGTLVPESPAPCASNCQAPGPPVQGLPNVSTPTFLGRGNLVEEAAKAAKPSASLTVARSVRGTSTSVRVKVSRAGSIRVSGAGLRQATVKARKAGTYRVTVRLSAHGVQQQRSRGRLATRVTARFSPQSGAPVTARKSVTFTAAKKGGR